MKNVYGEEINKALFSKMASEKLQKILSTINEDISENELLKLVSEYGVIMYRYGFFSSRVNE